MIKVEAEAPWTRVSRKRRPGSSMHSDSKATATEEQQSKARLAASLLSATQIQSDHEKIRKQWQDSGSSAALKKLFSSRANPSISVALCFGIGSFDPDDGSWHVKRRTHAQLAAFSDMIETLKEQGTADIQCLFQEPAFTTSDREFLEGQGHTIVDSPKGFEMVSAASLVFGVHLYRDVYDKVLGQEIPSIFVGTDWETWQSVPGATEWAKMQELDDASDKVAFPEDDSFYPAFTNTYIHWRKDAPLLQEGIDAT